MIKIYTQLLLLVSIFVLSSCVKKMDEAYIPSYISINNIGVETTGFQGSSSSNIIDAWVYLDGDDRGAYPLPSRIPLLGEGKHLVKISPGIKLNGIANTRVPYPLMKPIEIDLNLVKDKIINLDLKATYYSTSKFEMVEDFESSNLKFVPTLHNKAEFRSTQASTDGSDFVFEGSHSGAGFLNSEKNYFQIETKEAFEELPKKGLPVFIEMDFKCNTTFVITVAPQDGTDLSSTDLIFLNPTDEWTKIYINLTYTLSYDTDSFIYKFRLSANHNSDLEESFVLIDNFKLIYRDIQE